MKYWNSYDIFYDTYLDGIYDPQVIQINSAFSEKIYTPEMNELRTIINCSPFTLFKQRSRFDRREAVLFFDIIIDYNYFMNLTNAGKRECIAKSFLRDMEVLRKYKPKDFKLDEMKADFESFFESIGWLMPKE